MKTKSFVLHTTPLKYSSTDFLLHGRKWQKNSESRYSEHPAYIYLFNFDLAVKKWDLIYNFSWITIHTYLCRTFSSFHILFPHFSILSTLLYNNQIINAMHFFLSYPFYRCSTLSTNPFIAHICSLISIFPLLYLSFSLFTLSTLLNHFTTIPIFFSTYIYSFHAFTSSLYSFHVSCTFNTYLSPLSTVTYSSSKHDAQRAGNLYTNIGQISGNLSYRLTVLTDFSVFVRTRMHVVVLAKDRRNQTYF